MALGDALVDPRLMSAEQRAVPIRQLEVFAANHVADTEAVLRIQAELLAYASGGYMGACVADYPVDRERARTLLAYSNFALQSLLVDHSVVVRTYANQWGKNPQERLHMATTALAQGDRAYKEDPAVQRAFAAATEFRKQAKAFGGALDRTDGASQRQDTGRQSKRTHRAGARFKGGRGKFQQGAASQSGNAGDGGTGRAFKRPRPQ